MQPNIADGLPTLQQLARMSLIERQTGLVQSLEPIYRERLERGWMGQDLCGRRARLNRLHIEDMMRAGYSKREAAESAQQCNDVASLNAAHDRFEAQMAGGCTC